MDVTEPPAHRKDDKNVAIVMPPGLQANQILVFCMTFSLLSFARHGQDEKQACAELAQIYLTI